MVLDQPGEQEERSVKLIKVADAAEVARLQPLVEQLYTDRYQGNEQEPADAKIIAEPVTATLVVSGRENHVLAIEKMVAELGLRKTAVSTKSHSCIRPQECAGHNIGHNSHPAV